MGDPTPLRSPSAVAALWQLWADPEAVVSVARHVNTWGDLVALSQADRVRLVGPLLASVAVPLVCPPPVPFPGGAHPVTPYDPTYPAHVDPVAWPVLYTTGRIPPAPALWIAGASAPSPTGVEIARSAALACAAEHLPVVVVLHDGVGLLAARTAVAAGATVIAVLTHSLDQVTVHQGLLDQVRQGGGSVVTTHHPDHRVSPTTAVHQAAQLASALAHTVVLAEVGAPPEPGAVMAKEAISADLPLVVPTPPPHHVPTSALGATVLTVPGSFTPQWYGTSPRIRARVAQGFPAAEVVVTNQEHLTTVVRAVRSTTGPDPAG